LRSVLRSSHNQSSTNWPASLPQKSNTSTPPHKATISGRIRLVNGWPGSRRRTHALALGRGENGLIVSRARQGFAGLAYGQPGGSLRHLRWQTGVATGGGSG
jgi:hypothetical protein